MSFEVRLTEKARQDVKRLYAYMLDWDEEAAARALQAVTSAMTMLEQFPFSCRMAEGGNPLLRELLIPFGSSGYLTLFEITDSKAITILAVRHQREDDYH